MTRERRLAIKMWEQIVRAFKIKIEGGDKGELIRANFLLRDRLTELELQLQQAIELLKWALRSDPEHDDDFEQKWEEAKQFLKEVQEQ